MVPAPHDSREREVHEYVATLSGVYGEEKSMRARAAERVFKIAVVCAKQSTETNRKSFRRKAFTPCSPVGYSVFS